MIRAEHLLLQCQRRARFRFGLRVGAARSEDQWAANNIAWFLATCPDESLHNGELAVQFATRALRVMDESGEEQR